MSGSGTGGRMSPDNYEDAIAIVGHWPEPDEGAQAETDQGAPPP